MGGAKAAEATVAAVGSAAGTKVAEATEARRAAARRAAAAPEAEVMEVVAPEVVARVERIPRPRRMSPRSRPGLLGNTRVPHTHSTCRTTWQSHSD